MGEIVGSGVRFTRSGVCSTSGRLSQNGPTNQLSHRGMHERVTRAGRSSPAVSAREQISFGSLLRGTPSKARRDSLVCQSSMTMTGALASYDIPEQPIQKSMPVWLSRCIGEAAKHLDQAPFLQLMMSLHADSSFLHHSVPSAVVQVPQLWQGIAEHLAEASPEVVVLIHPINMTSSHSNRSLQAARESAKYSSTDVLTGIAVGTEPALTWQQKHAERMESCARMMQSGLSIPALSGSVGDCCDDGAKAQVPLANNILPRSRKSDRLKAEQQGLGQGVEYWGVVIQSRWSSEADGCYVLKTIRSAVEDCTCVHYSLVNVCQGEPYSAQMAARWLTT